MVTEHFIYNGPSGDRVWDSAKYAEETPGILVDFHVANAEGMSRETLTARVTGVMRDGSMPELLIISGTIGDATFTGRYHAQTRKGTLRVTTAAPDDQPEALLRM